jgi:hypothetical protein
MNLGRSNTKINTKMGFVMANNLPIMRVESLRKNKIMKMMKKMVYPLYIMKMEILTGQFI